MANRCQIEFCFVFVFANEVLFFGLTNAKLIASQKLLADDKTNWMVKRLSWHRFSMTI